MAHGYHRPATLDEAFRLASDLPDARYIAGGTDLLVQMRNGPVPPALISLRGLPELGGIESSERVRIGAGVPLSDVQTHPLIVERFPALVASISSLGSPQIRNVATIGGNLVNASPAADTAPPLLIYEASVELCDADGSREIALEEFLLGPGLTALKPGEILSAVHISEPDPEAGSVFLRRGRVTMDLPIASVAALGERNGSGHTRLRLAAGAVAPVPMRLRRTEEAAEGSDLDDEVRALAIETARDEIAPISDLRSTEDYRRHLTGVLVGRALEQLANGTAS
jgi:carbon-monoxide dehydrogenase medium subunit